MLATLRRLAGELRTVLSDLDPERVTGPDAAKLLEAFTDLEKLAAGGKLLTARRIESSNVWRTTGHRSAASHVAEAAGTGLVTAVDTLQAARQLGKLPAAEEAVREGRLSEVQVKEIATAAEVVPDAEEGLVETAVRHPLNVLRLECRRAKATGAGGPAAYRAIHRSRYLRHWTDGDGAVRLDAKLTPDDGARLLDAVKAQATKFALDAKRAGVDDPERAHAADALVRLVCGRAGGGDGAADDAARPSTGRRQRRGGSPGTAHRRARAAGGGGQGRASRAPASDTAHCVDEPPRAMVHVRIDHSALVRGYTKAGEQCEIPGIGPIPVDLARDLAGDSILSVLVTDGVDVTAVAHAGRTIPASIRRALLERDPVCVVPGCEVRDGLEIDHVIPFGEGGKTSLANLARLCRWHHYLKTHQRHRLERRGRQWVWVVPSADRQPALRC